MQPGLVPAASDSQAPASAAWQRVVAHRRAPLIAAGLVMAAAAALLIYFTRGTWFLLDELDFAMLRSDLSADAIFGSQNQNWYSSAVLLYRAMFEVFGFDSYAPWRVLETALVIGVGALGYAYARRRIGPWFALLPLALLIISPGYEILLWPFQMGQAISALAGLAVLVLLDREPARAVRIAIPFLLFLAVASSSAGVPLVAIFIYDRLLYRGRRLEALLAAPAVIAYLLWRHEYASREPAPNETNATAFTGAIDRAYGIANTAVDQFLGLGSQGARGLLIGQVGFFLLFVLICWLVFSRRLRDPRRVIALAGGILTYWLLLAWGRAFISGLENSPRYLFLTQILLVLLLVELAPAVYAAIRDSRPRGRPLPSVVLPALAGLIVVGVVVILVHNVRSERDYGAYLRANATAMHGQVNGLSLLPPTARQASTIFLEPLGPQIPRSGGLFFNTYERFGGKPADEAEVLASSEKARERSDLAMFAFYVPPTPATTKLPSGDAPPTVTLAQGSAPAQLSSKRSCTTAQAPATQPATVDVQPSQLGFSVTDLGPQPATVKGRRYATAWKGPAGIQVTPGVTVPVRLPPDRGSRPWYVQVTGTSFRVCALAAA